MSLLTKRHTSRVVGSKKPKLRHRRRRCGSSTTIAVAEAFRNISPGCMVMTPMRVLARPCRRGEHPQQRVIRTMKTSASAYALTWRACKRQRRVRRGSRSDRGSALPVSGRWPIAAVSRPPWCRIRAVEVGAEASPAADRVSGKRQRAVGLRAISRFHVGFVVLAVDFARSVRARPRSSPGRRRRRIRQSRSPCGCATGGIRAAAR